MNSMKFVIQKIGDYIECIIIIITTTTTTTTTTTIIF